MTAYRVDHRLDEADERKLAVESPNVTVRALGHVNPAVDQPAREKANYAIDQIGARSTPCVQNNVEGTVFCGDRFQ